MLKMGYVVFFCVWGVLFFCVVCVLVRCGFRWCSSRLISLLSSMNSSVMVSVVFWIMGMLCVMMVCISVWLMLG